PSDYYTDENSEDRPDNSSIHSDGDGVNIETFRSELVSQSRVVPESKNISNFNFVAVGDFYCNHETEDTIENILKVNPELIITTGDHVKNVKSAKCWIKDSQLIKDKMRIAIGNHDLDSKKIYKQITKHHNLTNHYYSHDFENIHFISMSTEHPYEEGSKQYEFIKEDLEKASTNPDIDWIIVHQHKAMYSTRNDMDDAKDLRNAYHALFEKFNVNFVITGHNQYYERTYPLNYHNEDEDIPIYHYQDGFSYDHYRDIDGIIFLTVGTGGDDLHDIDNHEDYYAVQDEEHGFLNLQVENNGKTIVGKFHSNDDDIIDYFTVDQT
ncbi:MAG: hypothetical protein R3321_11550, partial [Nitrososphaeraceae archaeon]|nr:hypothetical protein [Nitrososphaeraceae archaeon]